MWVNRGRVNWDGFPWKFSKTPSYGRSAAYRRQPISGISQTIIIFDAIIISIAKRIWSRQRPRSNRRARSAGRARWADDIGNQNLPRVVQDTFRNGCTRDSLFCPRDTRAKSREEYRRAYR